MYFHVLLNKTFLKYKLYTKTYHTNNNNKTILFLNNKKTFVQTTKQ